MEPDDTAPASPSVADISALSLQSLRVELCRRNCSTTGTRSVLERRLRAVLRRAAAHPHNAANPAVLTVPRAFPPSAPSRVLQLHPVPRAPSARQQAPEPGSPSAASTEQNIPMKPPPPPNAPVMADFVTPPVRGVLRANSVCVFGDAFATALWRLAGPIGKANLSRSAPTHARPHAVAQKGRALRERLELADAERGDGQEDGPGPSDDVEHLQLSLVEAYYTAFVQRKLAIFGADGHALDDAAAVWRLFCTRSPKFALLFVAYCRYRSVGWVPRSGLKYGADWVLYAADTTQHRHSPYCVVFRFREEIGQPALLEQRWTALQTKLRLVKNVNKALIIAEIFAEPALPPVPSVRAAFKAVRISEVTLDRWLP